MDQNTTSRSTSPDVAALDLPALLQVVRTHVRWWAVPAIAGAVLAAVYSLAAPRNWNATQALIVRPEAASVSDERTGKFADLSEMKTLQETILELARSQGVVQAALREVGPPSRYRRPAQWPTPLDVDEFRECIDMRPPGGAEFGKTEVFYLSIRDTDRQRAAALVAALCGELEQRMQEIRDQRAQGMVTELERTVAMADGDLAVHIGQLTAFEAEIGADLAELRNLNAEIGGQGSTSQELQTIESERRSNDSLLQENERMLELLVAAQAEPNRVLATPNILLKAQPALAQLKEALVAAEVHTASLLGSRSESHPFVVASRTAEQVIRRQLHDEIATAVRGVKVDIELNRQRDEALIEKAEASRERLARLAESRAQYANLVSSVDNHTRLVEAARKNLADARAGQAGARSASVISRIDGVEAGVRPVGPGRKTITAAGGFGGLFIGLGLVFLFANPKPETPVSDCQLSDTVRRCTDTSHPPQIKRSSPPLHAAADTTVYRNLAPSKAGFGAEQQFGLFQGLTLEEAVRRVQQARVQSRS